jgi:hypothetical protein
MVSFGIALSYSAARRAERCAIRASISGRK